MTTENVTSPEAGEVAQGGAAPEAQTVERDQPRDDNERAAAANEARQGAESVETEVNAEGEEVATEEFELDIGGSKHKFPKGTPIEAALDKVQQYQKGLEAELQRKSQDIAAKAKSIADNEKIAFRLQELGAQQAKDFARGQELADFVAKHETPEGSRYLTELWRSNPDQARQLSDTLAAARSEVTAIEQRLAQYGSQRNEAERQIVETRAREGEAVVAKAIKGFGPQVEAEMVDYAVKNGVPPESAKQWRLNPYAALTTWKAMQFDKLQAQAKAQATPKPAPAPVTPITQSKPRTPSKAVDLEKMSMDDYVAHMERREGRRR